MSNILLPKKFIERLDLGKTVTPSLLKTKPIHNWFYFRHSYSPELVSEVINFWRLTPGQSVIADPFMGAGTTLLTAKQAGFSTVGYDLLPISALASTVKTSNYSKKILRNILHDLLSTDLANYSEYKPRSKRYSEAFTPKEYQILRSLKHYISFIKGKGKDFFLLGLISIIPIFSRAIGDGGWLRWVKKKDQSALILQTFSDKVEKMINETQTYDSSIKTYIKLNDSRNLPIDDCKLDAIVTSPPYPNRHDYTRVYHMELLTLSEEDEEEIFELRKNALRSNVEAVYNTNTVSYSEPSLLKKKLKELSNSPVDIRIPAMIKGYFEDMFLTFRSLAKVMSRGGKAAFVVGNVRYGGIDIAVDEIIATVAEQTGFSFDQAWIARYRGNSAQQMKYYGKSPMRESILLFTLY